MNVLLIAYIPSPPLPPLHPDRHFAPLSPRSGAAAGSRAITEDVSGFKISKLRENQ